MLTGATVMPKLASFNRVSFTSTPYGWVPLAVIVLVIVLIFVRVYVVGDRSGSRSGHRSRRRTVNRASHVPERGEDDGHPTGNHGHKRGNHGHHSEPKRRSHRP
jgi:hypothetical protein